MFLFVDFYLTSFQLQVICVTTRTQQVFSNSLFQTKPKLTLIYEFHVSVGNLIGIIYLESRLFFAKTQSFWEA